MKEPVSAGYEQPKKLPGHTKTMQHHDESNWLISYADMMTLLCGFFIMLFSMSKLDEPKYETVKQEVAKQFKGEYTPPKTNEIATLTEKIFSDLKLQDMTKVSADPWGVTITFQSALFFDTLSAEVKPEGRKVLDKVIEAIALTQKQSPKPYRVIVEGHTDSRPVLDGIYPSNWELSGARSARVVRILLEQGFSPEQLASIGYADTHPLQPSRTPSGEWDEAALAKNRRVVLKVLQPQTEGIPDTAIPPIPATPPAIPAH